MLQDDGTYVPYPTCWRQAREELREQERALERARSAELKTHLEVKRRTERKNPGRGT